jgi:site-specific DNA-adenine methylase
VTGLRAPFPWPGGKRKVGDVLWRGLGADVPNAIEPFFGSGAWLLGRPGGAGHIETVNDIDGGLVNFWRAVKWSPRTVARWCDDPVSELDLHARHDWLIQRLETMREELRADPFYFDAQVAGWWVWGICQWIGTGWCQPSGQRRGRNTRPHISGDHAGMGVLSVRKRPNLSAGMSGTGTGVFSSKAQLPAISVTRGNGGRGNGFTTGRGVHSHRLPSIGNDRGVHGVSAPPCMDWFRALQERFRRTRIISGDWRRILGNSVLGRGKNVGGRSPTAIFFDPPYDPELRAKNIYAEDNAETSRLVREWCLEHGNDRDLRICLAGYYQEHAEHMPPSWRVHRWTAGRGYAREDNTNREQETLWFSPHCLPLEAQPSLFAGGT